MMSLRKSQRSSQTVAQALHVVVAQALLALALEGVAQRWCASEHIPLDGVHSAAGYIHAAATSDDTDSPNADTRSGH